MTQRQKQRTGILLTNLGTPDEPTPSAVRRYLAEFLSDKRVIEKPAWIWKPILYGVILNVRPKKAAKSYQKVWTENGSPLLSISRQQAQQLQHSLDPEQQTVFVELAMRYGKPSISHAMNALRKHNVDRIIVLPMYPQYSATTTASTYDAIAAVIKKWRDIPSIDFLGAYYQHPDYIRVLADSVKNYRDTHGKSDKLLMSFHGLPEAYIKAGDPYQKQCLKTASLLAEKLNLHDDEWICAFQSRFGVEQWIKPYTDKTLEQWAQDGLESVDIICPGFPADCLETLEEMAMENRDIFLQAGGKSYHYIKCLNDQPDHIEFLTELLKTKVDF